MGNGRRFVFPHQPRVFKTRAGAAFRDSKKALSAALLVCICAAGMKERVVSVVITFFVAFSVVSDWVVGLWDMLVGSWSVSQGIGIGIETRDCRKWNGSRFTIFHG